MKKVLITQSNYIPWKGYFDAINMVDDVVLYDDMQYTKRDWRNRNKIKTANGAQWITIPVEVKGKFFQKINETQISEKGWAQDHWKTILHNYRKAPCFDEMKIFFEDLYARATDTMLLSEVNHLFLKETSSWMGINTTFHFSNKFELKEEKTERLVSICQQLGANVYYTGPAAKAYMNESLFENAGIEIKYLDYSGYPEYSQLYPPFDHAVSIVDLLFNTGADFRKYMKSF